MRRPDDDELPNNLVATGAVFALLTRRRFAGLTDVSLPDGPGNQIDVTFDFLKSPYRLTIERVIDDE